MADRRWRHFLPILGVGLLIASALLLRRQLIELDFVLVWASIRALPLVQLGLAIGFTLAGYLAILGFDILALRYLDVRVRRSQLLLASFVSGAFKNGVSLPFIGSGGVRVRFYAAWGLRPGQLARMVAFIAFGSWAGLLFASGTASLLHPPRHPSGIALDATTWTYLFRGFGFVFLVVVGLAVRFSLSREAFALRRWTVPLPRGPHVVGQVGLGLAEWTAQGLLLYALLLGNGAPSLAVYLPAYFGAMFLARLGHIPAGLGVLDSGMLLMLGPTVPEAELVAALILFRVIYHLGPLSAALVLLGAFELRQRLG
ncbi:MAG: hypothetical protein ABEK03_08790 [Candidatus Bipolaricaulia bacterium]